MKARISSMQNEHCKSRNLSFTVLPVLAEAHPRISAITWNTFFKLSFLLLLFFFNENLYKINAKNTVNVVPRTRIQQPQQHVTQVDPKMSSAECPTCGETPTSPKPSITSTGATCQYVLKVHLRHRTFVSFGRQVFRCDFYCSNIAKEKLQKRLKFSSTFRSAFYFDASLIVRTTQLPERFL